MTRIYSCYIYTHQCCMFLMTKRGEVLVCSHLSVACSDGRRRVGARLHCGESPRALTPRIDLYSAPVTSPAGSGNIDFVWQCLGGGRVCLNLK